MKVQSQFIEMFGEPMQNVKGWKEYGEIGKYAQIVLGSTPNSKNPSFWDGDIKWITPAEMVEESYYIYDTERHLTEEGVKSANLTLLPCRSVLFSTRAPIGKVGLVGSPMYCNQGFKNFICGERLNPVYLYYCLILNREHLVSLGTGTTFKELSKKVVEALKIAVPPMDLQNRFEAIYEQADKSKFVCFKSQFIEMLSQYGYEEKTIGTLCDKITDGSHNPPKGNDGSEFLMISSKNVFIDGLDLTDVRFLSKEEFESENKRTEVSKNDILLTIVGTIGRTYLVKGNEGNIVMQRSVAVLKPSDKVNPLFLMYSLHIDENLEKEGRGNAQKGVYLKQLSQYKVKVPSLAIQDQFCTIYQQADKSKYNKLIA